MFEKFKDMGNLMKQAKEMKSQMAKVQEELRKSSYTGTALNNAIEVVVNGELDIKSVKISPDVVKEGKAAQLEKGVKEAVEKALSTAKNAASSQLSSITGNLNIPGL